MSNPYCSLQAGPAHCRPHQGPAGRLTDGSKGTGMERWRLNEWGGIWELLLWVKLPGESRFTDVNDDRAEALPLCLWWLERAFTWPISDMEMATSKGLDIPCKISIKPETFKTPNTSAESLYCSQFCSSLQLTLGEQSNTKWADAEKYSISSTPFDFASTYCVWPSRSLAHLLPLWLPSTLNALAQLAQVCWLVFIASTNLNLQSLSHQAELRSVYT